MRAPSGGFDMSPLRVLVAVLGLLASTGCIWIDGPPPLVRTQAFLFWSFPPNAISDQPTCDEAGVDFIEVTIDGDMQRYTCAEGFGGLGAVTPFISEGVHDIELVAVDAGGYPYYSVQS